MLGGAAVADAAVASNAYSSISTFGKGVGYIQLSFQMALAGAVEVRYGGKSLSSAECGADPHTTAYGGTSVSGCTETELLIDGVIKDYTSVADHTVRVSLAAGYRELRLQETAGIINLYHISIITIGNPTGPFALQATGQCVSDCPSGQGPNANGDCQRCSSTTPFADHVALLCVATCPVLYGPDVSKDCQICAGSADPYYDPTAFMCVAACGAGTAPVTNGTCIPCSGATPYANPATMQCVANCPANQGPNNANDCNLCTALETPTPYYDTPTFRCVQQCASESAVESTGECK